MWLHFNLTEMSLYLQASCKLAFVGLHMVGLQDTAMLPNLAKQSKTQ